MILARLITLATIITVLATTDKAEARWGIGLHYPGVQIKYLNMDNRYAVEMKGAFSKQVQCYGLRGSYYFSISQLNKRTALFWAIEGDYISFKGEKSQGNGWLAYVGVGGEYWLNSRLALGIDFGPVYIALRDKKTAIKQREVDYVANISFIYYF